jgi:hypothetical protein
MTKLMLIALLLSLKNKLLSKIVFPLSKVELRSIRLGAEKKVRSQVNYS